MGATKWPDKTTGSASISEQETVTVNALGQTLTNTDRNGSVHTQSYDVLGRIVSDAVTTLGSGVDGSVRRIETAYDGQGNPFLVTSYDAASSGSIVNQIQRVYNGLGQLITEYQSHSGTVNTSTTPKVQYAYSEMPSDPELVFDAEVEVESSTSSRRAGAIEGCATRRWFPSRISNIWSMRQGSWDGWNRSRESKPT